MSFIYEAGKIESDLFIWATYDKNPHKEAHVTLNCLVEVYHKEAHVTLKLAREIIYPRKKIHILSGNLIQLDIVNIYPKGPIFLLHE